MCLTAHRQRVESKACEDDAVELLMVRVWSVPSGGESQVGLETRLTGLLSERASPVTHNQKPRKSHQRRPVMVPAGH